MNSRLIITDEKPGIISAAMFGEDGTALRADLAPLRALAIGRRLIEAAERKLREAGESRPVCETTAAVLAEVGL